MFIGLLPSCNQNGTSGPEKNKTEIKTAEEAILAVETYLKNQLGDAQLAVGNDGLIAISGDGSGFVIDPTSLVIGRIDDDDFPDAIIAVSVLKGQVLEAYEHLILLQIDGKFVVIRTLNDVLKIIGIKDRIITAEVSTVSPDSPGFGCAECKEVVKYKFNNGSLMRSDQ